MADKGYVVVQYDTPIKFKLGALPLSGTYDFKDEVSRCSRGNHSGRNP